MLVLAFFCGCASSGTPSPGQSEQIEAKILQSWQGDYPVARLERLPEKQRDRSVGFIGDAKTFEQVWKAFKPGEDVPEIDFKSSMVLFVRNTQFYNHIRIGKVNVANGVAQVLTMETLSAMPIEEKVAMSLAVVPRSVITSIRTADGPVLISNDVEKVKSLKSDVTAARTKHPGLCRAG